MCKIRVHKVKHRKGEHFVNEIKHVLITIGPGINISKTNVIDVFNF